MVPFLQEGAEPWIYQYSRGKITLNIAQNYLAKKTIFFLQSISQTTLPINYLRNEVSINFIYSIQQIYIKHVPRPIDVSVYMTDTFSIFIEPHCLGEVQQQ